MDDPFPRKVTATLNLGLNTIYQAANEAASTGSFDAFEAGVGSGVSANLCDAIVQMARPAVDARELSVATSWAASRPVPVNPHPVVRFLPQYIPVIEEAARLFRESSPLEDAVIVGPVVNLHRDPDSPVGVATVACVLEGKTRHLRVELRETDYELAIQAHREKRGLSFEADVLREERALRAANVRDLRLLE